MDDIFKDNLENGEKLLWTGGSKPKKIFDSTYCVPYLLRFLISYGLAAAFLIASARETGFRISVFILFLVLGSMIPLSSIADGLKSKGLGYAATDRRLMKVNGSMTYSANYEDIEKCEFCTDSSGNTSLLCGSGAIKSRPSKWRGLALFTGELEMDKNDHVDKYVLYAVDDPEGLKNAITDKVHLS